MDDLPSCEEYQDITAWVGDMATNPGYELSPPLGSSANSWSSLPTNQHIDVFGPFSVECRPPTTVRAPHFTISGPPMWRSRLMRCHFS